MPEVLLQGVNPAERAAAADYFAHYDPNAPLKPWEIVLPGFYRGYIPAVQAMRYVGLIELGMDDDDEGGKCLRPLRHGSDPQ